MFKLNIRTETQRYTVDCDNSMTLFQVLESYNIPYTKAHMGFFLADLKSPDNRLPWGRENDLQKTFKELGIIENSGIYQVDVLRIYDN